MKEYKLISLDEYEKYIKWKNEVSGSNNQEISKPQDKNNTIALDGKIGIWLIQNLML